MRSRLIPMILVVVVVGVIAGKGLSGAAVSRALPPTPAVASALDRAHPFSGPMPAALAGFYEAPDPLPTVAPGSILKVEKVAVADLHGTTYRVMYASRSPGGAPVAVTGIVVVPRGAAQPGGYPVVSWAHGTNGLGDRCAPSISPGWATPNDVNILLDRGWEVVASDYAGEGGPGVLPYLSGSSAGRSTIDIVRAARRLPAAHASDHYVVWGYSEGGHAALFALHMASTYAPELHLDGDVAGGPPSNFATLFSRLASGPSSYYIIMVAIGLNAAYGEAAAPLDEVLTPAGLAMVPELEHVCLGPIEGARVARISVKATIKADPFTLPGWRKLLAANDPENFAAASPAPLLLVQGGADDLIPPASTQALAAHVCSLGQDVDLWEYPGINHAWGDYVSAGDVIRWIAYRFAGGRGPLPHPTNGRVVVPHTTCPAATG